MVRAPIPMTVTLVVLTAPLALSGCFGGPYQIDFDGEGAGVMEQTLQCGSEGASVEATIRVNIDVSDGELVWSVEDNDGDEMAEGVFSDGGEDKRALKVTGAGGGWEIEVVRGQNFEGEVRIGVTC